MEPLQFVAVLHKEKTMRISDLEAFSLHLQTLSICILVLCGSSLDTLLFDTLYCVTSTEHTYNT